MGPVPEISVHNAHCPSGEILGNRNGLKKRFGLGGAGNASLTRRVTPETISRTYTVFWNGPGTMSLDSDTKMTSRPSADMFATNAPEIDRAPDGVTLTITSSHVRRSIGTDTALAASLVGSPAQQERVAAVIRDCRQGAFKREMAMRGPARLVRGNRAGLVERAIAVGIAVMHVNAGVRIDDVVVDQIRRGRFEGHEPSRWR